MRRESNRRRNKSNDIKMLPRTIRGMEEGKEGRREGIRGENKVVRKSAVERRMHRAGEKPSIETHVYRLRDQTEEQLIH